METLLPAEALHALNHAIELEILTQELDADVVRALPAWDDHRAVYRAAYRQAGRRSDRERQILFALFEVGTFLDHREQAADAHPRALRRTARRRARRPAKFLERGLDALWMRCMEPRNFLDQVRERETQALKPVLQTPTTLGCRGCQNAPEQQP